MKHLMSVRTLVGVMSVAVLMATMPAGAWAIGTEGTTQEERDYAQRDSACSDLASFQGGWHGVLIFFLFVAAFVIVVDALFCDAHVHRCPQCPHPDPYPSP